MTLVASSSSTCWGASEMAPTSARSADSAMRGSIPGRCEVSSASAARRPAAKRACGASATARARWRTAARRSCASPRSGSTMVQRSARSTLSSASQRDALQLDQRSQVSVDALAELAQAPHDHVAGVLVVEQRVDLGARLARSAPRTPARSAPRPSRGGSNAPVNTTRTCGGVSSSPASRATAAAVTNASTAVTPCRRSPCER